ncbi:DUF1800 domain-containing protein [Aquabacterium lacunae]|nr:DUF1800 domain-containing protein [Aquabacterium lacunae]
MLRALIRLPSALALSLGTAAMLSLVGCGGGAGDQAAAPPKAPTTVVPQPGSLATIEARQVRVGPSTDPEAARFLTQATFGPTPATVAELRSMGYEAWVNQQLALQPSQTHRAYWLARDAELKANNANESAQPVDFNHSFWRHALQGQDQLRQRVAFALSQIFVVSSMDGCGADNSRGLAHYYDTLAANAFGSYRTLLEAVARHPVMGCYLSHLRNQKENATTGRVPDENFAREVMQLFSIGLYQLNANGTPKRNSMGQELESYTSADVAGLAKVFTGLSYDCPNKPSDSCFLYGSHSGNKYDDRGARPMVAYPQFHSTAAKSFLGVTVPAQTAADPEASLAAALNQLATVHPNVGPFIGKQLIQRLVTSNPSEAYVLRVTQAFEASGRNLGAMVRAVLLDPEARDLAVLEDDPYFGKAREPVLKLSAFLRAVGTSSDTGRFLIDHTDNAGSALGQSPLRALSVFNFYRPGYMHAGGEAAKVGLVAPELQLANETSAAGYVNYMMDVVRYGAGRSGYNWAASRRDVQPSYALDAQSPWLLAANKADASQLLALIDQRLFYGAMPANLKAEIKTAVEGIRLKATPSTADTETKTRLWSALLLAVASPEFQVQR